MSRSMPAIAAAQASASAWLRGLCQLTKAGSAPGRGEKSIKEGVAAHPWGVACSRAVLYGRRHINTARADHVPALIARVMPASHPSQATDVAFGPSNRGDGVRDGKGMLSFFDIGLEWQRAQKNIHPQINFC